MTAAIAIFAPTCRRWPAAVALARPPGGGAARMVLTLARHLSPTPAGNLTVVGSVANLIVLGLPGCRARVPRPGGLRPLALARLLGERVLGIF